MLRSMMMSRVCSISAADHGRGNGSLAFYYPFTTNDLVMYHCSRVGFGLVGWDGDHYRTVFASTPCGSYDFNFVQLRVAVGRSSRSGSAMSSTRQGSSLWLSSSSSTA